VKVTVFGGSSPKPGDLAYKEARSLGRLLGEAGHTVVTGGYIGTMEAVSRGAAEAGAHVIGITCAEIETFRPGRANSWVAEEIRFDSLYDRLQNLIETCDAAIALPGGPGTLAEISVLWNRMLIHALKPKPMVLVGSGWRAVFDKMFAEMAVYVPEKDRKLLSFAETPEQAVEYISPLVKA